MVMKDSCHDVVGWFYSWHGCALLQNLRKRLRYLSHLPLTCEFQVVEVKLQPPVVSTETLGHFASQSSSLLSLPCSLARFLTLSLSDCISLFVSGLLSLPLKGCWRWCPPVWNLGAVIWFPFPFSCLVFLLVPFLCLVSFLLIFHSYNFLTENSQALSFRARLFCMAVFEQLRDHGW